MAQIDQARSLIVSAVKSPLTFLYLLLQEILAFVFSPAPPPPTDNLHRPRIAVIGAGLTGVSSAAHCVGHGFDVKIFEARPKSKGLGGIWSVSDFISFNNVDFRMRLTESTAGQFDFCSPNSLYYVPLPPLREMGVCLPKPGTN